MRHFTLPLILVLVAIFVPQTGHTQESKEKWNVASWEPGLGVVFRHQAKFSAVRLALGTSNILLNNRVGVYYILEYRGGIKYQEDATNFYFRDLFGLNYSVNKSFSVHGGLGVFRKGLLQSGEARGGESYFNSSLRKEIGIIFRIPQRPLSIDLSYSTTVGPAATFRYVIPMKQNKLGNESNVTIPESVPVLVETNPEKIVILIDTIVIAPVLAETKPDLNEPVLPIVEFGQRVDINVLAKKSTTYYPQNVDTLSQSNMENLQELVEYLNQNLTSKITVFGYADQLGSESYNLTLSASRAKQVNDYLVSKGIQANRIKTLAYGESKAKGESEEERALNRCVEFSIRIQLNK